MSADRVEDENQVVENITEEAKEAAKQSYILIKFSGVGGAIEGIQPVNVTPEQFLYAGAMLREQANYMLSMQWGQAAMQQIQQNAPQGIVSGTNEELNRMIRKESLRKSRSKRGK